jgi:hypothetical protein
MLKGVNYENQVFLCPRRTCRFDDDDTHFSGIRRQSHSRQVQLRRNCQLRKSGGAEFSRSSEGTAVLSTDRSASVDMDSSAEGRVQLNGKLGGRPTEAPGGSASLSVAGRHTLRAVREYPNNYTVVTLTVIGNSCSMKVEDRLKPGKRQYTFHTSVGLAYCSKPHITRAECSTF